MLTHAFSKAAESESLGFIKKERYVMSSAATHAWWAAMAVGVSHAAHDLQSEGQLTPLPLVSGVAAGAFGSLPDWIEPATSPNHRQFFHSVVFLGGVCYLTYRVYRWEPETSGQSILRWLGLVLGGAYIAHLVCDSQTPRSLPMIGAL